MWYDAFQMQLDRRFVGQVKSLHADGPPGTRFSGFPTHEL